MSGGTKMGRAGSGTGALGSLAMVSPESPRPRARLMGSAVIDAAPPARPTGVAAPAGSYQPEMAPAGHPAGARLPAGTGRAVIVGGPGHRDPAPAPPGPPRGGSPRPRRLHPPPPPLWGSTGP